MENFYYNSFIEYQIISLEIEPDIFERQLGITATRSFKKGEKSISKKSGSIVTKPHNMWVLQSIPSVSEGEIITNHIEYLKTLLLPKFDLLQSYKHDKRLETIFWVWVETDNSGLGLHLGEDEIEFINHIASRLQFSIHCNVG